MKFEKLKKKKKQALPLEILFQLVWGWEATTDFCCFLKALQTIL